MRGRIASFAIGSAIARRRTEAAMNQAQYAQQQEIEQLKAEHTQQNQQSHPQQSANQEDLIQKLEKLADLHQKGVLTDEEFQKLKMKLIAN